MTSSVLRQAGEPNPTLDGSGEQAKSQPPEEVGMGSETTAKLRPQGREIVALGASVGSGCHPCVTYHVDASRTAGLGNEQLAEVVLRAHAVAVIAADRIAREGLRLAQAASDPPGARVAADRANELAALGAAMAANSMADIEEHLAGAMRAGLAGEQLVQAASVAYEVQANAASIHARKTARMLKQGTADDSSAGQPVDEIGSRLATAPATDDGHPADPVISKDPELATDRSAAGAECEVGCACHDEVPSQPGFGAREQARAGIASGGSRASEEAGAPWASMLGMMGGNAVMPGSCCAPAVRQEAPGNADHPTEPGCDCGSDSSADEIGKLHGRGAQDVLDSAAAVAVPDVHGADGTDDAQGRGRAMDAFLGA